MPAAAVRSSEVMPAAVLGSLKSAAVRGEINAAAGLSSLKPAIRGGNQRRRLRLTQACRPPLTQAPWPPLTQAPWPLLTPAQSTVPWIPA